MQDPTDGYIGIRNKGKNFVKIKEHEAWLADEMANFRDEKFMYYIFINIMWIIVSCVILKYSYMLMSIEIPLGDISLVCSNSRDFQMILLSAWMRRSRRRRVAR
jgi:hypothetical protein